MAPAPRFSGSRERMPAVWNDSNRLGKTGKLRLPARNRCASPRRRGGSERRKARTDHDTKYLVHLGQPGALSALASRRRNHRHDRLRLVDEPHPGAPGPFFLSLDPCRYRLSRAAADGAAADVAWPQPDPGLAGGHAALATDGGEPQPLVALRRDHSGFGAWLGAFRRPHAEVFGLVRAVSRSADHFARPGGGPGVGRPPYPVRVCAAG